jgi:DNA-binding protein Fis
VHWDNTSAQAGLSRNNKMSEHSKKRGLNGKEILFRDAQKNVPFQVKNDDQFVADFRSEALEVLFDKKIMHLFMEYYALKRTMQLKEFLDKIERTILLASLSMCQGNQKKTAKFLGLKYTTLSEKIKKHQISFNKAPFLGLSLLEAVDRDRRVSEEEGRG